MFATVTCTFIPNFMPKMDKRYKSYEQKNTHPRAKRQKIGQVFLAITLVLKPLKMAKIDIQLGEV